MVTGHAADSGARGRGFAARAVAVLAFGVAFGYVEAAVVVDFRRALGLSPDPVFPLPEAAGAVGYLVRVEVGRELATLVILAATGWLAGRSRLERLAWSAVAFGGWDIAYYGWLAIIIGWPPSLVTWDVLFLVPVPWVGPVWAPLAVSLTLVVVGLLAAQRLRAGRELRLTPVHLLAGVVGGVLVVASFLLDAGLVLGGGVPETFAWPVFAAGMIVALAAAADVLRGKAAATG